MISNHRDTRQIALVDGVDTDSVVRQLVEQGVSVFEIVREAEALESFYLSLMSETKVGEPGSRN